MTTTTQTLAEFILARYAELEATASHYHRLLCLRTACETCVFEDDEAAIEAERVCTCGYPAYVLADIKAKRRIVEHAAFVDNHASATEWTHGAHASAQFSLRALAQPFRDHPEWREEWAL